MDRIIIYGLGNNYEKETWGRDDYDIVALCDRNASLKEKYGDSFITPNLICDYDYDYILVTSTAYKTEMINTLIEQYDIPAHKIKTLDQIKYEKNKIQFYGQELDDMKILFILKCLKMNVCDISYLELGTNDPVNINNTYFFYNNGARGVLVEPNKKLHNLIRIVRPEDRLIPKAVDVTGVKQTIFYEYEADTLSTTRNELMENVDYDDEFKILSKEYVDTICVNDIFKSMPKVPEIFLIDIEGKDLDILKDIDFDLYKPLIIHAELGGYKFRKDMHEDISSFLESKGYKLQPWWENRINGIFIRCDCYNELIENMGK